MCRDVADRLFGWIPVKSRRRQRISGHSAVVLGTNVPAWHQLHCLWYALMHDWRCLVLVVSVSRLVINMVSG